MLTLVAEQPECLWDEALPVEVKALPADLAVLDVLMSDHELLWPIVERWQQELRETGRLVLSEGRPTIAMETYIRFQGALPVGVSDVGGGGIGLDSPAAVLSDLAVRAGGGRVDGAQADQADRCGDGVRAHARVDREGLPGEAVSP